MICDKKGVSLIESIVSIGIFAFIMLLFATMFLGTSAIFQKSAELDKSFELAANNAAMKNLSGNESRIFPGFTFDKVVGVNTRKSVVIQYGLSDPETNVRVYSFKSYDLNR